MAVSRRLFQQIQNAGPDSHRIIGKGALLLCNPVGNIKTDSRNITCDLVRTIFQDIDSGCAILLENTAAVSQRNAVVLEKNHQAANRMMRFPGFCNLFCNGFADALTSVSFSGADSITTRV